MSDFENVSKIFCQIKQKQNEKYINTEETETLKYNLYSRNVFIFIIKRMNI